MERREVEDRRLSVTLLSRESVPTLVAIERTSSYPAWNSNHFQAEFSHSFSSVLGAEYDTELVGFIILHTILDEMHIVNLGVHRDRRRQGVATFLMEEVFRRSGELHAASVTLEVRRGNLAARSLYEKYGFRPVGVRQGYYPDTKEDALILRWRR